MAYPQTTSTSATLSASEWETLISTIARQNDEMRREVVRLRAVLMQIASCESIISGDVVDIARKALEL